MPVRFKESLRWGQYGRNFEISVLCLHLQDAITQKKDQQFQFTAVSYYKVIKLIHAPLPLKSVKGTSYILILINFPYFLNIYNSSENQTVWYVPQLLRKFL